MGILKFLAFILACEVPIVVGGWRGDDAVKLKDVEVLTLYHGRMTNAGRSAAVPQLKCVGGTAGCHAFRPQVVQCYNRGWDGQDVQWECKTDMDNAYRFGQIAVSCEGYSHPDDPYILRGSCGLEYTLDLTKEGYASRETRGHNYYGNAQSHEVHKGESFLGGLIFVIIIGFIIYALYRTCLGPAFQQMGQNSPTDDDYRPPGNPGSFFQGPTAPPPPGFNPEFTRGASASCGGAAGANPPRAGGFWTGAATGGILGYMFGSRNNSATSGNYYTHRSPGRDYSSNSNWGGTSEPRATYSTGGNGSTGTRTASGFGGTKRR